MKGSLGCAITVCGLDGGIFPGTVLEASGSKVSRIAGKFCVVEKLDEFTKLEHDFLER